MFDLQTTGFEGAKIVEHRIDQVVVGEVVRANTSGGGTLVVWWDHDDHRRTTMFHPKSWTYYVVENVVFLQRTDEDKMGLSTCDLPWDTANLYTIVRK